MENSGACAAPPGGSRAGAPAAGVGARVGGRRVRGMQQTTPATLTVTGQCTIKGQTFGELEGR
jgi:hypothetical protein